MLEEDLKKNLKKVTGQEKLAEGEELLDVIKWLDESYKVNGGQMSSKLKHYLVKRSYGKALGYIETEGGKSG